MQLKSVEMVGFKSFADRLVLDFGKGITGIVGPNGSGKSNVADAIRWVLGEQSAKSLRGVKMEDVIFAGTQRRRPVSFAQVVLTLDNSDRSLACDYDEVAVSRKMFRSGESEYMINGARCRLRDIQELFMDTGIGKDGYSMIGQGRIDQLLSNKPQDRRAIFEEASGIVKFKVRREEANAKLAQEQTSLQRVTDILEEASSRLEPLRESAERAEKYKTLYAEFRQLEIQNFLRQYDQLAGQSKTVLDRLADLTAQTEEAKAYLADIRKQSEQASADAEAAGQKLADTIQKMNDLRLFRESRTGEQKLFQSQAEQNEKDRKNAEIRLEDARKALKRHQETAVKVKEQLASLEQQKEKQMQEQAELAARGDEIREAAKRAQEQLASFRTQLEELRNGINAKRQDLVRQETLHEQVKGEQGSRAAHLEELQTEVETRQADAEQKKTLLEEAAVCVQN
jgi:chromosome segregation protein